MTLFLLLACAGGSTSPDKPVEESESEPYAWCDITFFGDYEVWTNVVVWCDTDTYGEDSAGKSGFSLGRGGKAMTTVSVGRHSECTYPRFNVPGSGGLNTNPDVLGISGEELYLWVTDALGEALYPRTTDADKDFFEGGAMYPFDPEVGWLYLHEDD